MVNTRACRRYISKEPVDKPAVAPYNGRVALAAKGMVDAMDARLALLNSLLVETFNEILKVEERSLRLATQETVTVTEMHILDAVEADEPRAISALAAASMVTVSTMTIAVNRLEKKDLVERVREAADRRVVRVRLTDRGRALAHAHQRFHRRMARAVAQDLSEEELTILTRAMGNLRGFFHDEAKKALSMEMEAKADDI